MIEFYFDISSPWTYLAFHNIQPLARELDVEIDWKPILVGGVFNAINPSVYASREKPVPAKARYMRKDLQDWTRHAGLAIRFPPSVFPVNSVKAMRACIALAPEGKLVAFARAAFEAYWGDDQDISQDAVLAEVARRARVGPARLATQITATGQGCAEAQHRRVDHARRLRLADDLRRRLGYVFRQRPNGPHSRGDSTRAIGVVLYRRRVVVLPVARLAAVFYPPSQRRRDESKEAPAAELRPR